MLTELVLHQVGLGFSLENSILDLLGAIPVFGSQGLEQTGDFIDSLAHRAHVLLKGLKWVAPE